MQKSCTFQKKIIYIYIFKHKKKSLTMLYFQDLTIFHNKFTPSEFNNVGAIPPPMIIMHIKHQVYLVSKDIYGYILIKIM